MTSESATLPRKTDNLPSGEQLFRTIPIHKEELFSSLSHGLAAATGAIGTIWLALHAASGPLLFVGLVYCFSMMFMFTASATYHALRFTSRGQSLWRRIDHLAIFFMIAGSYTPICFVHLNGAWRWSVLGVQWGLVALGLLFKLYFLHTPRWVTAAIYVVMGWIALIPINHLAASMPSQALWLLFLGGVSYTVGALIYAVKRPNPFPGMFGFHEIFHVFVVAGAAFHYALVVGVVT